MRQTLISLLQHIFEANNFPIQMTTRPTFKAFISYAHDDKDYFEALVKGLKQHSRLSTVFDWKLWDDRQLLAGEEWKKKIGQEVRECDFAILLISAGFFNSSFIAENELGQFLRRVKAGKRFLFIPILVRSCDFTADGELSAYQFFPADGKKYGRSQEENGLMPFSRLWTMNAIPIAMTIAGIW